MYVLHSNSTSFIIMEFYIVSNYQFTKNVDNLNDI